MKIQFSSIADSGDFQKERVVFKVLEDTDIGRFAALYSDLSSNGKATAGKKLAYWFPDGEVKKDDLVVLYTKEGSSSKKDLESGSTAHFFYWGEKNPLWDKLDKSIVLLSVDKWRMSPHKTGD